MAQPQPLASLPRHAYARHLVGERGFDRIAAAKVLVVGAGGIGCELLKNLVLVGFGNIETIDLDTIDLSNLNRQFLFNKSHINKPKSTVAAHSAAAFNPHVRLVPHHANVKDPRRFGYTFFRRFDVVLNALDNLDARRWVNRMCVAADVPLVESGTTGFLGQVQPILKDRTQCYDCTEKPTPRSYPVCTIRSTPSAPVHCVHWAKTWLFVQLFGADDETEDAELDKALEEGEDASAIANLRAEAREMRELRKSLIGAYAPPADSCSGSGAGEKHRGDHDDGDDSEAIARRVFDRVFCRDIERLLSMETMWRNRRRPVPLRYEDALKAGGSGGGDGGGGGGAAGLRDQRQLSVRECAEMFARSLGQLARRAASDPSTPLSFDKDDDASLDFVASSSNLRCHAYGLEPQTRFQVKQTAGNIIPAIASTNAVVAGAQVLQAVRVLLREDRSAVGGGAGGADPARATAKRRAGDEAPPPRYVKLGSLTSERRAGAATSHLVASWEAEAPNPACGVCADVYAAVRLDPGRATLRDVLELARRGRGGEEGGLGLSESVGLEVYEAARLLYDEDFRENVDKPLSALGVGEGQMVTLSDEDGERQLVHLIIVAPSAAGKEGAAAGDEAGGRVSLLEGIGGVPEIGARYRAGKGDADEKGNNQVDDDDDDDDVVALSAPPPPSEKPKATPKRTRAEDEGEGDAATGASAAGGKKRRADVGDEDGDAASASASTSAAKRPRPSRGNGADAASAIELD